MIVFPNAKINLGLNVIAKRDDGFHEIESIMVPVSLCDVLEVIENSGDIAEKVVFSATGLKIPGDDENLCTKAYKLLDEHYGLPSVLIHLHKIIPIGAGLGGGSSDAVFVLTSINELFELNLTEKELIGFAGRLGSDCAFFIKNSPCLATGRGEQIEEIEVDLGNKFILVINPGIHIGTSEAYSGVKLNPESINSLKNHVGQALESWKSTIHNSFEDHILIQHPEIKNVKEKLYDSGAIYAAMTGSGSSVYGIFDSKPKAGLFPNYFSWTGNLSQLGV